MIYRQKGVHHLDSVLHGRQDKNQDSGHSHTSPVPRSYSRDKDKMVSALNAVGVPLPWAWDNKNNKENTPRETDYPHCNPSAPLGSAPFSSTQLCSVSAVFFCELRRDGQQWERNRDFSVGPGNFPEEEREQNDALVG